MKKVLSFVIKLALVLLAYLLVFSPETLGLDPKLFGGVKPIDMWYQIRDASRFSLSLLVFWLALASGVKLLGIFSGVIRWKLLLRGQGIVLPFWYMTYLWFAGRAIGMFIPGTLGLDGWRLVESSRYTGEWVKCTTVIAVEKLTGFIALTLLVLITFPFGFKLLDINAALFSAILVALFCFTAFCMVLLFNPRVIQVAVTVLPVPRKLRGIVNRLGAAATAYSNHRGTLILAVVFGLGVHLAICLMTFCTMMAIRAQNTTIFDIMFASPIMIYASVLTPTINGMGVRELIFGYLLGTQSGHDAAVTFGHLGLWTGEFIPFLISIPLLLLGGRPSRAKLNEELAEFREHASGKADDGLHLTTEQVTHYRRNVYGTLIAGGLAGLVAGAAISLIESSWLIITLSGLTEVQMFVWGPVVYGVNFAGVGLATAAALLFGYLVFDRFPSWPTSYALSVAGAFVSGGLVIGTFRYKRDVLAGHAATLNDYAMIGFSVFIVTAVIGVALYALARAASAYFRSRPAPVVGALAAVYVVLILVGLLTRLAAKPESKVNSFNPSTEPAGPNIILVSVDALRADYLTYYNPNAKAKTPALNDFAEDAVLFKNAFSQASWTKPSFGTIFTGLYPEQHTATTKTAALPPSIETLAELLNAAGYYTKGFPNNPNVSPIFGFDQGFVEYTYLEPSLYFGAESSSAKLALYEVLRRARQTFGQKVAKFPGLGSLNRIKVTDFYQPAEVVTNTAIDWLNGGRPKDARFYLYLHYMDTHDPFIDPESPEGGYARVRMEHPDPDKFTEPMKESYIREIEHLDTHVGRLFDALKEKGVYDEALIVFVSDHGEEFYDHEGWWHGQTLYDELTKVPLMIKLPHNGQAGTFNENLARHIDLAPTILYLAGLQKPLVMPGQTLWDPTLGFTNSTIAFSYAENDFEGNILRSVRTTELKIIHANEDNKRSLAPVELYDMTKDPLERQNVADEPETTKRQLSLEKTLQDYKDVIDQNAAEPTGDVDPKQYEEQMKSLGYL